MTLRVEGISTAKGWGGHFSLDPNADGYGGRRPECHVTGGADPDKNVFLLCYDGFLSSSAHANQFEVPLGIRKEVDWAELEIRGGQIAVRVQRRANSPHTSESIPYEIQSLFPLRSATGFCSGTTLYYSPNGVLAGRSDRGGSGYRVTVK